MESSEWGVLALIVIIFTLVWRRKGRDFRAPTTKPASQATFQSFEGVRSLFVNSPEQALFHCLNREVPQGYYVMSKVRLEDIIKVKSTIRNREIYWKLRQRVNSRHVDFLIINDLGAPIMAIELDGSSHSRTESRNADDLKNGLFKQAEIPLKRVIVGEDFKQAARNICEFVNKL